MYSYKTKGTCSKEIQFDVENGIVTECKFIGGCPGNTVGAATLVKGMTVDEVISRLKGVDCAGKGTSCPDQLARALEQYKESVA